jgi:hypothetical protein
MSAGDIDAEDQRELAGVGLPGFGFEGGSEGERRGVTVGDFDADVALAGDGGLDANGVGRKGKGEVFLEGDDGFDADAEAGFDAELGHARADDRIVDERVDRKTVEGVLQNALVGRELLGVGEVLFGGAGWAKETQRGALISREFREGKRRGGRSRESRVESRVVGGCGGFGGSASGLAAYGGGEVGGAIAEVLADAFEMVDGVVELVAVAGLVGEALFEASLELVAPPGQLVVVLIGSGGGKSRGHGSRRGG